MNNQYMNQHDQTYRITFQNSSIAVFSTSICTPVKGVTHLEIIETMSPRYFICSIRPNHKQSSKEYWHNQCYHDEVHPEKLV